MDTRPFKMDFEEFCAAAMSVAQLEGREASWERQAREAYEIFDKDGNRVVVVEDLAKVRCNYRDTGFPNLVCTLIWFWVGCLE
jgi:Ca2+-binding EF-hand superfamily protein